MIHTNDYSHDLIRQGLADETTSLEFIEHTLQQLTIDLNGAEENAIYKRKVEMALMHVTNFRRKRSKTQTDFEEHDRDMNKVLKDYSEVAAAFDRMEREKMRLQSLIMRVKNIVGMIVGLGTLLGFFISYINH